MKSTSLIIISLFALSGCLGIPEGTPNVGDTVTVDWVAFDAETGERLDGGSRLTFRIGSGSSGLGFEFEHGVVGHATGDTFRFTSDDPSRDYRSQVEVDRFISQPVTGTAPRSAFEQQIGPAVEGNLYPFGFYDLMAVNVTASQVTFRYVIEDGQRDPLDFLGATLVTSIRDEMLVQELEPVPDATFLVQADVQGNTILDMPAGSYRTIGSHGDHITYAFAAVTRPNLVAVVLDFEVTIASLQPAAPMVPDGNYGVRKSPQILADPALIMPAASDGHDGHTH